VAGYQLLGDAFNTPKADQSHSPVRNESLHNQTPQIGHVKSNVEQANLADPHAEVSGMGHRVQQQIHRTGNKIGAGQRAIETDHDQNLQGLDQTSKTGFAEVANIKAAHFKAAIAASANDMPSAAEASYNYLGGSLYNSAKNIESVGAGTKGSVSEFIQYADEAYSKGADAWEAIKYGASQSQAGFTEATKHWADQRVSAVAERLTPSQQAYYRAAMIDTFAGVAVFGENAGDLGVARQNLLDEEGQDDGSNIAQLLKQAVGQNRNDLIDQIGNYNRARGRVNY
jgi:conjugal transfer mating pair stabilization protein TraG